MTDWFADPPIYAACTAKEGGRVEAVRALLLEGADPNAPDYRGYPPLAAWAVQRDPALMDLLLEAGADPNAMSRGNRILGDAIRQYPFQRTPEDKAVLFACVKRLLAAGADPNQYPHNVEYSPLWIAIQWQWVAIIPVLLEAGADPTRTDAEGHDARAWAIQCERPEVIRALVGSDEEAAAAIASQDAACDQIFDAIVQQLRTHGRKLHFRGPGSRYDSDAVVEYYWEAEEWVEVRHDEYAHKGVAHAVRTMLGPSDQALRDRIVKVEQLHLTINKPRARAWRRILSQQVRDRSNLDLIAQRTPE